MTQITATLDSGADPNLIRRIFENIKGVIATSVSTKEIIDGTSQIGDESVVSKDKEEWKKKLNQLCASIDRSVIDYDDERTKYILSK